MSNINTFFFSNEHASGSLSVTLADVAGANRNATVQNNI